MKKQVLHIEVAQYWFSNKPMGCDCMHTGFKHSQEM